MIAKLKNTLKHTVIYSFGNLSTKLVGIILLPIYTEYLTTSEYGALMLLETTAFIMTAVFSFKLSTAMMRWCTQEKDENKRKTYVFTTYIFSLCFLTILNLLFFPLYEELSIFFFDTSRYYFYFPIIFISVSFEILNLYPLELIRIKEKSVLLVFITIVRLTFVVSTNIILMVKYGFGIESVLIGQATGHVLVFLFTISFLLKNMRFEFNLVEFKQMCNYGIPLVFSTIAMMLLNLGDRYIIKHFLNYSQVGIYSLGHKISSITNMFIILSFQRGFLPVAYKMFDKPEANRFFSKTLTYYTLVMVGFSLIISIFSKEIVELFAKDESFFPAYTIIPFISVALMLKGIQYVFSLGLHFTKKTQYNALIVLVVAGINVGLNFIFIPMFGIYGAAVTTIFCWIIMAASFYLVSRKFYPVNYETRKIILLLCIFVVLFVISIPLNNEISLIRIPIKIIIIISLPIILIPFRFYEKIEIERLKEYFHKIKIKN